MYTRTRNICELPRREEPQLNNERSKERKRKREEAGSENILGTVQAEVGDVVSNPTDRMIVEDVFEEPLFSVGDLVMIVKDTTPGMDPSFSYDKEERITMVMSGRPNHYNVKLLHEAGTEEVTEL